MNIIFDLDGTLIDSKNRLYRLFQHLVPESTLSYNSYWTLKKNKVSNLMILKKNFSYSKNRIDLFLQNWRSLIESPDYLALDEPIPKIQDTLIYLQSKNASLYIATARQNETAALDQVESMGLLGYFERVLVTQQKHSKETIIAGAILKMQNTDWIIGDTGKDIEVGNNLGLRTCAVCTGFLSKEVLESYRPDLLLATATEFKLIDE